MEHLDTKESPLVNPCQRNCCLDDNDLCMGCFRTLSEILGWSKMSQSDRKKTLDLMKSRQGRVSGRSK
nr:DUF1289 domain-containing protein [Neptuniibacter caesariensis]